MASKDDGIPYAQVPDYIFQVVKAVRQGVGLSQSYGGPMLMPEEIAFDMRVIYSDNALEREEDSVTSGSTSSTPGAQKTVTKQPTTTTATVQPTVDLQNTSQFQQGGGSNRNESTTEYEVRS